MTVAAKDLLIEFDEYDLNTIVADTEAIRNLNYQRFEMEQLTAVVHVDESKHLCVGYKDITADEFWVRGHMPGMPLMPGVIMCEAAAQLCSYLVARYRLMGDSSILGFGGLDEVRFRGVVVPGDRLVIVAQLLKLRKGALVTSKFQGFVDQNLVVEGIIKGVPLPVTELKALRPASSPS